MSKLAFKIPKGDIMKTLTTRLTLAQAQWPPLVK